MTTKLPGPGAASAFPDLTPNQLRLLGYCAYRGGYPPNPWTMTLYDGRFEVPRGRTEADRKVLEKKGLLVDGEILPRDFFRIAVPIVRSHPEWVRAYADFSRFRSETFSYLWSVAECLAAGSLSRARKLRLPAKEGVWQFFTRLLFTPEYGDEVLTILPPKDAEQLLAFFLEERFEAGELDETALSAAREAARRHFPGKEDIPARADAYAYYLTGALPKEEENVARSFWTDGVRATDRLLRGDVTGALEAFLMTRKRTPDGCDGTFPDRLMTWFYALCLVRNRRKFGSTRAERAQEALEASTGFRFNLRHAPTQTLLSHMDSNDKDVLMQVSGEIRRFLERDRTALGRDMALAVLRYFKMDDRDIESLGLDPSAVPVIPVFRNEAADLVPTSTAEKERLRALFGGPGALSAVPRKEAWEMTLCDLSDYVSSSKDGTPPEKRIIYFLDEKWITAVIEQSRFPGEEGWSRDRLLSRSTLIRNGYDSMDVLDLKLAGALGNKVVDKPDVDVVLPILAGTGRIFTGQFYHQPYKPFPIREEAPFVAFTGKGGAITVTSNVERRPDGSVPAVSVIRNGQKYTCIRTNPLQRDILSHLLETGTFPATALPAIRRTINSLEGMLEVRSSLGATAVIPTLQGSARMCLRISPLKHDDGYDVSVSAAPREDGDLRCEPGRGDTDVYDDTSGEPRFVRRDLQAEFDNFVELRDHLQDELGLELDKGHCELYASESLLGVLTWAYDHGDRCFVEWPEGRALRFRGDVKSKDIDISVKSGVNWFEVEGEIAVGKDKYDLDQILQAMRESDVKGYIKLGDKDYVRMTKALQRHLQALESMMTGGAGRSRGVPLFRVGQLAQVLGDEGGLRGTMDEGFKNLLRKMQQAYDSTPEVPQDLKATLRDYQKEGYVWMKRLDAWGAGACLADDMGLGKTVQSIAFLLSKAPEGPSLVVAPKSVVPNWDIELARFAPTLKVTVLNEVSRRDDCIDAAGPGDVVLTTYGVLNTEQEALSRKEWNVVCLDEAHQIKNRNTRVSVAAMSLQASSRLALTGTPIQNNLGELWNLFQFINPGLLGQWADFKARYLHGELDPQHGEFLRDTVQPFILRRTKDEVLDELPEKIVCEQMVELSPEEMKVYEAMRQFVEARVNTGGNKKGRKKTDDAVPVEFFAELTKLRLAANSLSLVYDDWKLGSSKTDALLSLIDKISAVEGNQVVVFSQFTSYLAQVRALLDRKGIRYLYLDGQTDLEERREIVRQFQEGDCPLFLASLKAGGLGLNLTAANYVILLDPWWNPAIEDQAMDRAHRIGQQRTVNVIRLIALHTIEEKILRLHETKRALSDEMLDGTAYSGKLTMDDVLDMVSPFR